MTDNRISRIPNTELLAACDQAMNAGRSVVEVAEEMHVAPSALIRRLDIEANRTGRRSLAAWARKSRAEHYDRMRELFKGRS